MSTITKEFTKEQLQQIIETDHVQCGEASALARIALASLEAEPVAWAHRLINKRNGVVHPWVYGSAEACPSEGDIFNIEVMPLYTVPPAPVSVPAAMEMDDDFDSAFEHGKAVGWNACRAAMLQGADGKPELTVWYGSMPESNGKANWTAILHRKGEGRCMDGFTIDRSEYPGRVLYAADRVRYLIGEKSERPSILDYDADAHSRYVKPGNSPVIPDGWVACSERMPDIGTEIFYFCQDDGMRDCGIVSSSNFSGKGDAELYVHAEGYDLRFGVDISHWMPLPAAPQQEVNRG
ncbi:TPA: DUF551 domain-containing protein [Escherichia coli]